MKTVGWKIGASQVALVAENPPANEGDRRDTGSVPESGRSPGDGNGNPLQYSCQENPTDRGAWWATVYRVTEESETTERLNNNNSNPGLSDSRAS